MVIKAGGNTEFSEQDSLHSYCMGHSFSKFLPVKSGVLSINVMKFLVCREYEWMLFFFTLPLILIRNCIWSIYIYIYIYMDAHLMQRLRIYGAFPPLFFISAWHGA